MDETCAQDDLIEDIRAKVTLAMEEAKASDDRPKLEKQFRKRQKPESEEEIDNDDAVSLVSEHLHLQTPEKKRNKR